MPQLATNPQTQSYQPPMGLIAQDTLASNFADDSSQAAITLVNNKGDIGQTLSDLASRDTVKAALTAIVTAGILDKISKLSSVQSLQQNIVNTPAFTALGDKFTYNLINATGRALTYTAINGGSLGDAIQDA